MFNFSKQGHFRFIAFMLIISTFLPLIFANLPPVFRSHHIWTVAWFASILALNTKTVHQNLMGFVLIYGLVMILILLNTLYIDVNDWNKNQLTMEFYEITVAISVIIYFRMERDYVGLANLVKWTMIFLIITGIMSFVTALINPLYARNIIGVSTVVNEAQRLEILSYQKYGGGGYGYASALVCLFPLLMYYFKNKSQSYYSRKILMLFIIIFLMALFAMQIYANIMIAIIFLLFSWFGSKNIKRGFVTIGLLSATIYFIPIQAYINLFQNLASLFDPGSDLYYKFNDTAMYFATGGDYDETGMGSRAARYPLLWESFKANPFFGHFLSNKSYIDISEGAHLFWMNKLGVFGMLGLIPFIYIIYRHVKINLKYFDKEFAFYFLLSVYSIVALGAMKTLGGRDLWYTFFIIVPGFYYLPLLKKKNRFPRSEIQNTETAEPAENPD